MSATAADVFVTQFRLRCPVGIRHDADLSMSCAFYSLFEDINREFSLTSGNLEIVIEMLISSLAWLIGQHNETFKWFFQGLQIVSGNGHFRVNNRDLGAHLA